MRPGESCLVLLALCLGAGAQVAGGFPLPLLKGARDTDGFFMLPSLAQSGDDAVARTYSAISPMFSGALGGVAFFVDNAHRNLFTFVRKESDVPVRFLPYYRYYEKWNHYIGKDEDCTMEYIPVCVGKTTYANPCRAAKQGIREVVINVCGQSLVKPAYPRPVKPIDPVVIPTKPSLAQPIDPIIIPTKPSLAQPIDPVVIPTKPSLAQPIDPVVIPTKPSLAQLDKPIPADSAQPQLANPAEPLPAQLEKSAEPIISKPADPVPAEMPLPQPVKPADSVPADPTLSQPVKSAEPVLVKMPDPAPPETPSPQLVKSAEPVPVEPQISQPVKSAEPIVTAPEFPQPAKSAEPVAPQAELPAPVKPTEPVAPKPVIPQPVTNPPPKKTLVPTRPIRPPLGAIVYRIDRDEDPVKPAKPSQPKPEPKQPESKPLEKENEPIEVEDQKKLNPLVGEPASTTSAA